MAKINFNIRAVVSVNCEMEIPEHWIKKNGKISARKIAEHINQGNTPKILSENWYDFQGRTINNIQQGEEEHD